MILTANSSGAKVVDVTLLQDEEGDVAIKVNGLTIAWMTTDGNLLVRHQSPEDQAALLDWGFIINKEQVEVR